MKMDKSMLKNGMHVITRNGNEYVIMSNAEPTRQTHSSEMIGLNMTDAGFIRIDKYNDDLTCNGNDNYDIQSIYVPHFYKYILSSVKISIRMNENNFDLIAERN